MRTKILSFNIPAWAVCPLENSDGTGLNPEDLEAIERFESELEEHRARLHASSYCFSWPSEECPHFCSAPAFGLPADCYATDVVFFLN